MKACILCPGPSLAEALRRPLREEYETVVGVNRAAEAFACDDWVALDVRTFGMTAPMGRPTIVTSLPHFRAMCREWPGAREYPHLDPRDVVPQSLRREWATKGLLTAVAVAWARGADVIDCFGLDWEGEADFDGRTFAGQKRTVERWQREAEQFARLAADLARRGAAVTRVRPTPA